MGNNENIIDSYNNVYSLLDNEAFKEKTANQIMEMNKKTEEYGLILTKEAAYDLVETRTKALKDNGLIEFDAYIINKIIDAFYSSSHISKIDYEETLNELIERFYDYRLEYSDLLTDDLILEVMRYQWDKHNDIPFLTENEIKIIKYNKTKNNSWDYGIDNPYLECEKWGVNFD